VQVRAMEGLMSPSASSVSFEADAMQLCNKGKVILDLNGVNVAADGALSKVSPEDTAAAIGAMHLGGTLCV